MKRWEKFSKEQLQFIVDQAETFSEVLEKVGYSTCSKSSEALLKEGLNKLQVDYTKFQKTFRWAILSDAELQKLVFESKSLYELKIKLGYSKTNTGIMNNLINYLQMHNIDFSHFNSHDDDFLGRNTTYIRKILIKERGDKCEKCGINQWLGNKITLQVHHIDGNNTNNIRNNLQLLCPNCHSLTDNWSKRKADL